MKKTLIINLTYIKKFLKTSFIALEKYIIKAVYNLINFFKWNRMKHKTFQINDITLVK